MEIKLIKTEHDYNQAMMRFADIFDAKKSSPEGDELEILGMLIEKYEKDNFNIHLPNPIEAIKFRLDQMGLKQSDLALFTGSKSHVSEIMNGKRKLSLDMIRTIHKKLGISLVVLVQEY